MHGLRSRSLADVTSLCHHTDIPRADPAALYRRRWLIELLRDLKATMRLNARETSKSLRRLSAFVAVDDGDERKDLVERYRIDGDSINVTRDALGQEIGQADSRFESCHGLERGSCDGDAGQPCVCGDRVE